MKLSIVAPVFNEVKNVPAFLSRLIPLLQGITPDFEVIFCLDPSTDGTEGIVLAHRQQDPRIKLLKFSRRFGQPAATLAGMTLATGEAVIVMDVDLQDPPELIREMVEKWRQGSDVVYAQRRNRVGETAAKRLIAYLGYKLINRIADVDIPPNTGDFRLMSRRVVEQIIRLKETHGFLRGMVAIVGFKQTSVLFDRPARHSGEGNYNRFFGSIRIGMNGVVCFSNYLLSVATVIGFGTAAIAFLTGFAYVGLKLAGVPFPIGNPTIVILVLFLGGVQLVSVGILGEYIGRIYDEVKQRPRFIIDEAYGFGETSKPAEQVA